MSLVILSEGNCEKHWSEGEGEQLDKNMFLTQKDAHSESCFLLFCYEEATRWSGLLSEQQHLHNWQP